MTRPLLMRRVFITDYSMWVWPPEHPHSGSV